ncbi:hypothetical protein [Adhaeribacter aquaticus]|uniref:hypothetical protein n=1 Tax=Adhaeribacter aquaticus TaxID=299567 RepID=UPI0004171C86|nr:hypothetical protein [Adhaeribacter aquaticus]
MSSHLTRDFINAAFLIYFNTRVVSIRFFSGITAPVFNQNRFDYNRALAQNLEAYYNYQETILSKDKEVVDNLKQVENYTQA